LYLPAVARPNSEAGDLGNLPTVGKLAPPETADRSAVDRRALLSLLVRFSTASSGAVRLAVPAGAHFRGVTNVTPELATGGQSRADDRLDLVALDASVTFRRTRSGQLLWGHKSSFPPPCPRRLPASLPKSYSWIAKPKPTIMVALHGRYAMLWGGTAREAGGHYLGMAGLARHVRVGPALCRLQDRRRTYSAGRLR
jgi:hypothetical protein